MFLLRKTKPVNEIAPYERSVAPAAGKVGVLHPDGSMLIDCQDIREFLLPGTPPLQFIEG